MVEHDIKELINKIKKEILNSNNPDHRLILANIRDDLTFILSQQRYEVKEFVNDRQHIFYEG